MIKSMNLSQFVDKEVQLTFRDGEKCVVVIKTLGENPYYPFYFIYNDEYMSYTKEGRFLTPNQDSQHDIIKIEHHNVKHTMTEPLKDETMRTMVRCLTPEAIRYIEGHEKYAEMIFSLFDEFLTEKIGEVNEQVKGEMSCYFMDGIDIRAV